MPRKGRELEELVSYLEEQLDATGVAVKSPEYILGRNSNSLREIDVSLRKQVGSTNVLVIVECRDREATQDTVWIEQLAGKCSDVGAQRAVAVSSSRFSKGAVNTAHALNIELRTVEELDAGEIELWFSCHFLKCDNRGVNFECIKVLLKDSEDGPTKIASCDDTSAFTANEPVFRQRSNGDRLSLTEIWQRFPASKTYRSVPTSGEKVRRRVELSFSENDGIEVETIHGVLEVGKLVVDVWLWINRTEIPVSRVRRYRNEEGILSSTARFELDVNGLPVAVELHQIEDSGDQLISVHPMRQLVGNEQNYVCDLAVKFETVELEVK